MPKLKGEKCPEFAGRLVQNSTRQMVQSKDIWKQIKTDLDQNKMHFELQLILSVTQDLKIKTENEMT